MVSNFELREWWKDMGKNQLGVLLCQAVIFGIVFMVISKYNDFGIPTIIVSSIAITVVGLIYSVYIIIKKNIDPAVLAGIGGLVFVMASINHILKYPPAIVAATIVFSCFVLVFGLRKMQQGSQLSFIAYMGQFAATGVLPLIFI